MQHLQLVDKTGKIKKDRKASINERSHEAVSIYINVGAGIPEEE
jgi:hypothetical protein